MIIRNALRIAVVLFLLFPFLFLVASFRGSASVDWPELFWAFKNSFLQASLSAFFSVILGLWAALGLVRLKGRNLKPLTALAYFLCLLPNFLPAIFMLLAVLNAIDPFPMGVYGIALVHTFINFGLVAILLTQTIESKLGGMVELAYIEGASRWQFMTRAFFPLLKRDIAMLGLFVFVICFGSFSVPLVVGGARGTTIEVLIYEKIRLSGHWSEAIILAFLQSVFIFMLAFIVQKSKVSRIQRWARLDLIGQSSGVLLILLISALYIFGYLQSFLTGLTMISTFYDVQSALFWSMLGTLIVGLSVGIVSYLCLMLIAYCTPKLWFEKFLSGYVAPSTALACFALLLLGPNDGLIPFIKIPLAIVLLSLNTLYRMGWDSELESLRSQWTIAYVMGASKAQIFREILFPQISARAGMLAGLASVWACGDFAVSRILAHRDLTLAMMTETLMSGYRLHQATLLSAGIIVCSAFCFLFIVGVSRVLRRKFAS